MSDGHCMRILFYDKDNKLIYDYVFGSRIGLEIDIEKLGIARSLRGIRVVQVPIKDTEKAKQK